MGYLKTLKHLNVPKTTLEVYVKRGRPLKEQCTLRMGRKPVLSPEMEEDLVLEITFEFLGEIPSDRGSVTSTAPSDDDLLDEELLDDQQSSKFQNNEQFDEVDNQLSGTIDEWDSEDDMPLTNIAQRRTKWTKNAELYVCPEPFREDFGRNILEEIESPVETFLYLFTEQLIKKLVFETNLYSTQEGGRFTSTTFDEIKSFLRINIMMGLTRKPSYKDYWSSRHEMRDLFISSAMGRDRP
ncbi:piggybac transposable element-derived protein 4 [Holotrichia oblita]|uniref:Piggybac transposable element-derived protein 4 n=1 Tax=Holotrichia oblita TaxID=644536 RepID=A0ACB9TBM6_HOLOL|nr:piggybac transposable element-derived protein 4 [Holotrichia oblita]